jgi:type II secretory pathway predicted ATPase ExeA/septal ring-binding cell division protein DamX
MYLDHFGLTEPPFRITPHTDFFFAGANRGATLDALLYAITHDEGIVKVSGEVGSGKTMLCRVLIERLPKNVETIFLASPSLCRDEILHALADDLHVPLPGARTTVLVRALQEHLIKVYAQGRRVVLLIDEAHAMPAESLEEVRLLSNLESSREKLLQIVLFGQPELDERLAQPGMRQLRERITHSFRLQPLVRADIESYLEFRLRHAGYRGACLFSLDALVVIARTSAGLTRRINILADKALLAAYADGANQVTVEHARAAVRDSEFADPGALTRRRRWLVPAALGAGLCVGAGAHWLATLAPRTVTLSEKAPTAVAAARTGPAKGAAAVDGNERAPSSGRVASPASSPTSTPPQGTSPAAALRGEEGAPPPQVASSGVVSPMVGVAMAANTSVGAPSAVAVNDTGPSIVTVGEAVMPPAAAHAALGRIARDRYLATQSWLRSAPGGRQSIQLAIFGDAESGRMENFLRQAVEALNPSEVYVYSVIVDGRQHYRVAYGSFASASDIQAALEALPPMLKAQSPFQRSVGEMRRLNQAS